MFVRVAVVGEKWSALDLSWIMRPRIGMACFKTSSAIPLFERVNSARGKGEIDRASADNVPFARIGVRKGRPPYPRRPRYAASNPPA